MGKLNLKVHVSCDLVHAELLAFSADPEVEERGKIEKMPVIGQSCLHGANGWWRLEFRFPAELCLQMLWTGVLTCMFGLLSIYTSSVSEESTRMRILY